MTFVYTARGDHINLAFVKTIRETNGGRFALFDGDGQKLGETRTDPDTLPTNVVPAALGFMALKYWPADKDDAGEGWTEATPVLAWSINGNIATPLVFGDYHDDYAVEMPNGTIVDRFGATFDNRKAWLAEERESLRRRREARSALPVRPAA